MWRLRSYDGPVSYPMIDGFTAVIEAAEEGGFWGFCPEVPGANGQGETVDAVKQDLLAAIELVLLDRREDGLRGVPADALTELMTIA